MFILTDLPRINPHNLNTQLIDQHISEFRAAVRADPDDQTAHYGLGVAFFNLGLLKDSARELEKAAELMPENPNIQTQLASVYEALATSDPIYLNKAADRVQRALLLRPGMIEALNIRSKLFLLQGGYENAVRIWRSVAETDADAIRQPVSAFLSRHENLLRSAPIFDGQDNRPPAVKTDSPIIKRSIDFVRTPRGSGILSVSSFVLMLLAGERAANTSGTASVIWSLLVVLLFFSGIGFAIYFCWRLWRTRSEQRSERLNALTNPTAPESAAVLQRDEPFRSILNGSAEPTDLLQVASYLAHQLAVIDDRVRFEAQQREQEEIRRIKEAERRQLVETIETISRNHRK